MSIASHNTRHLPQQALADLRRSSVQLCWYLETRSDLDAEERRALEEAVGEIFYVTDGLSLALGVESDSDEPDFRSLIRHADLLSSMVNTLVSH